MAAVTYRDGIAILQLIIFPVILVAGILIWKRVGWRAGGKTWRFVVTLSLLRIIGSICTLLTINNDEERIYIAAAVCELIGIAPLLLTYVGLMRQIDTEQRMHPKCLSAIAIVCIIGLILGIAGISMTDDNASTFHPNGVVQGAMGIFIASFVVIYAMAGWLACQLRTTMNMAQKKLFLAIGISWPFLLIRIVYSAITDFASNSRFAIESGDTTTYLCMNVLEEIIAMALCVGFGFSAVFGMQEPAYLATDKEESRLDTTGV